ncbi:DNA-processing protein DprA [Ammoniphilus sp. YIM 78166]|uniref:DNA-processing protein DprA n=1 Tax=Ammoniphilus sp. YIM 78166 TaxID=1644106 RepID=UPI0014315327|nr:DNA-processing protein DprA [Ammoniphilus sp. YIM 78166]
MTVALEPRDWLIAISQLDGIGRRTLHSLLPYLQQLPNSLTMTHLSLPSLPNLTLQRRSKIKELNSDVVLQVKRKLKDLRIQTITRLDSNYPPSLLEIADPPYVLYARGNLELLSVPAVAVVGTRMPTHYGRKVAFQLSAELSDAGYAVISGLAKGVDTEAHKGSLPFIGRTIAILGSGINVIYPRENEALYKEIIQRGLILSEYPPGYPSHPLHFPARNRLISGLSLGVVVVEAAVKSGSAITVRCALDQGKDVFAVPGPIYSPLSQGTNLLIQEGAKLVTHIRDILEELPSESSNSGNFFKGEELTERQSKILDKIEDTAITIDQLAEEVQMPVQEVLTELLILQIKGKIERMDGSMYAKRK